MFTATIAVACGGALGAVARFGTVTLTQYLLSTRFPVGTLLVNCCGSYLIGFIMSLLMERFTGGAEQWRMLLVVGFLGAYTTFSSFAWETWVLYASGQWFSALINILINNLGTLLMVLLGIQSARLLGS